MPHHDDVAAASEQLLARADSMLSASVKLIDQACIDDARDQIFRAYWVLTEAIENLHTLLL